MVARLDLRSLPVLLLDCQTTGASPRRGHLLEVAWAPFRAADHTSGRPLEVRSVLVALPVGARVPPRVTDLTGIRRADLEGADSRERVWARLEEAARETVGRAPGASPVPAVAHFARFERAFLEALHQEHGGAGPFPLDLVCTHELACRLWPELPRRGLRALAGRLGHPLGELKRAAEHVRATAVVWAEFCERLVSEHDVVTLSDLRTWSETVTPARRGGRDFAVARSARLDLPDRPGVYRMLGRGGQVLYLGKATSLKQRVNGYFQKHRHGRDRMLEMLTQTWALDVTPTDSPLEAALLEADEIKEHQPPYNVALRECREPLYYADAGLGSVSEAPAPTHPLGPFPRRESLEALMAASAVAAEASPDRQIAGIRAALGLPDRARLDVREAREGLAGFVRRLGVRPGAALSLPAVIAQGARLWRTWLAEREERREEDDAEGDAPEGRETDEPERHDEWTAPRVEAGLLQSLRVGSHLLRRARWLVDLSESSVGWSSAGTDDRSPGRILVVERGRVTRADDRTPGPLPLPPGWPRSAARRLSGFDRAAYDRLRVLTTELRRLVGAGARVEVCLGPRRRLETAGLARRLRWL